MIAEGEACLFEQKGTYAELLGGSVEESSTSLSAVHQYTPIAHDEPAAILCSISLSEQH